MFTPDELPRIDTRHLWLEISENDKTKNWQQSQDFSTSNRRWNAYLNRLTLNAFLPWLHSEHNIKATPFPNLVTLPSIWEAVNGTSISFGSKKLVLIPTEATELDEIRVPQEWLDIPSWVADYYLGVQVNLEENCIRIWGYTTHKQLKEKGNYDTNDRSYSLNAEDLISNLNIIWLASQLGVKEATRAEIAPLPTLAIAQAESLLQRLGNPKVIVTRTKVPFTTWGAILEHGGWRQRLYEQRQGKQQATINNQWNVGEWLQNGVSEVAQKFGWVTVDSQADFAGSRSADVVSALPILVRRLMIAGEMYELQIQPKSDNLADRIWRFELRNATKAQLIPPGFKLRLLTADLQPFANNEVDAKKIVERLYLEVALGDEIEGLVWEVEPIPEGFEREILYV
ncbi:DUF1822 family protein [Brunnivagina elsteri]|uniref:DUF1822 domain-containing protein n=1 Tax=Brunnivagina elsteri CCALA 953 TaxID=987040 RepID=A0A2A2TIL0_9CYAN|nr:DUF1822 family protein [Calothrix elsteri]PAX53468.1 hypothetical protein CK510_13805 [Calothrix elsteri CCALA 953]